MRICVTGMYDNVNLNINLRNERLLWCFNSQIAVYNLGVKIDQEDVRSPAEQSDTCISRARGRALLMAAFVHSGIHAYGIRARIQKEFDL